MHCITPVVRYTGRGDWIRRMMAGKKPRPKLYWVETDDHCEDWFIVARSAHKARRFHEELEGYGRGEARSTLVMTLEEGVKDGWPQMDWLAEWGTHSPSWTSSP